MARKRRSSSKSISVNLMDLLWVAIGAVGNYVVLNPLLNKVTDKLPFGGDQKGKILTAAKAAGAGWAAFKFKKLPKEARLGLIGVTGASAIELGGQILPDKMVALSGTGDLYTMLGNTEVLQLPINPAGELAGLDEEGIATFGVDDIPADEIAIFGAEDGDLYDD